MIELIKKSQRMVMKLKELKLDFNDLFILECFCYDNNIQYFNILGLPSMDQFNLSARYQHLKREEYLVEDPNDTSKLIISRKGTYLLEELSMEDDKMGLNPEPFSLKFGKSDEEKFEEWWETYPRTTSWEAGETKFTGSRSLRNIKKADAKKKYLKLLNQGLKHEELLGSLKYEIKLKKVDSIKRNTNQMDYFKGMESYLNQERYLIFLDSYNENPDFVNIKEIGKLKNVTDI